MNLIDFFKSLFNKKTPGGVDKAPGIYPGVIFDTRPPDEQLSKATFGEIVTKADPVDWKYKPESEYRQFAEQDQNGQSSCVANAGRKALRIMFNVNNSLDLDPSSLDIYRRRYNYPEPGMAAFDLWNICAAGVTLNDIVPSDKFSEAYANAVKIPSWARKIGDVLKVTRGIDLPNGDIDAVASVIQKTGKGVVLFYFFTESEWSRSTPYISGNVSLYGSSTLKHAVVAVDYVLIDNVKYLVIEDSAHFGGKTRRLIRDDFHKARNFYAGYPMNFVFNEAQIEKPRHTFVSTLDYGDNGSEVAVLQDCLKYEGVFPANVASSGYYGAVTADAVLAFQKKYAVASEAVLKSLAGRTVGPSTRDKLNALFA